MEEYRNKLKIQNVFFSVCSAVLIAVQILAYSGVIDPVNSGKSWADFWNGFIAGVALGVTAIMIFGLIKNLIALKNNKQLKKLYVKENDERKKEICTKGKSAGATAYLCCMIAAAILMLSYVLLALYVHLFSHFLWSEENFTTTENYN